MSTLSSTELKERERTAWASVASGWKRRDALLRHGAAPVMTLVRQVDDGTRDTFIAEVIATADTLKQGDTLCMRGTTWLASGTR